MSCPQGNITSNTEFISIIHNPAAQNFTDLVRIQLPSPNWRAEVWNHVTQNFTGVQSDILTQHHMNNTGYALDLDYDMYLPYRLLPNQVGFVRVIKTDNATK